MMPMEGSLSEKTIMFAEKKCSNCGGVMEEEGVIKFRVGGSTGYFASAAQESIQPLLAYKCTQCQKVDFYVVPKSES
jgi:hypothetical protein